MESVQNLNIIGEEDTIFQKFIDKERESLVFAFVHDDMSLICPCCHGEARSSRGLISQLSRRGVALWRC